MATCACPASAPASGGLEAIQRLIEDGHWQQARSQIDTQLRQDNLDVTTRQALLFEQEKMDRIRLDFTKTRPQVLREMQAIVPEVDEALFERWERQGSVERLDIDGRPWYFARAAANVFRVNAEAKALKEKRHPPVQDAYLAMRENIQEIIARYKRTGETANTPKRFRVTYALTVKPGVVPAGETVRAWLPFPRADGRQREVRLLECVPRKHVLAGGDTALSSIYLEQIASAGQPVHFKVAFEYTSTGRYQPLDPAKVQPVDPADARLAPFLCEQSPHIVFSPELQDLARQIVGAEKNPFEQARRIFQWIDQHVPWASAREYSTIPSLSRYALQHHWGDCGIQTMLFMTLCRSQGIPARWESGWTTGRNRNMHDWCQVYLAPYGWVPVDSSYGLMNSDDDEVKWFYLGNIDSYRLVLNSDYAQPLYPAKIHFRSEIVDFQRGEVEWRGGNLYFNQWEWDSRVEEVPPANAAHEPPQPGLIQGGRVLSEERAPASPWLVGAPTSRSAYKRRMF